MFQQSRLNQKNLENIFRIFGVENSKFKKITHLIKLLTALNYAKEEESRQARGVGRMEREAMIYTRLFMFLVLSSSRKCAQSYAYRYSIIGSDQRFSPPDPSVLRNNVVPLFLFPRLFPTKCLFFSRRRNFYFRTCTRIRGQEMGVFRLIDRELDDSAGLKPTSDSDSVVLQIGGDIVSGRTNGREISILINFLIELIKGGNDDDEEDDSDLNVVGFVCGN